MQGGINAAPVEAGLPEAPEGPHAVPCRPMEEWRDIMRAAFRRKRKKGQRAAAAGGPARVHDRSRGRHGGQAGGAEGRTATVRVANDTGEGPTAVSNKQARKANTWGTARDAAIAARTRALVGSLRGVVEVGGAGFVLG